MKKSLIIAALSCAIIVPAGCEEPAEAPLEEEVEEEEVIENEEVEEVIEEEVIEDEAEGPDDEHEAIEAVVKQNLEATENEDVQGVLETMHADGPGYDEGAITAELEELFASYDLEYELEILDVRIENGQAEVDFRQVTRSLDNQEFDDNQITGVHIMRQQNGEWKIYDTLIEETELID